ncbi:MAG: glycerol-3-phosphate 1-O-acyltransferase [Candidatus Hydrogenedentota bacterium]|nr:MAG: glycerol-3-phosphate 1-O-acyltransferase [Candidatus Hydrogenedentota bacterium]
MDIVLVLGIISSYLLGSIPFSFLIGKAKGIDIRLHGSGNVGATNVFRVVGKAWGILALFLDLLKGLIPVLAIRLLLPNSEALHTYQMVFGLFAILGHTFPVWLKFKGGKGVATGLGVMLGLVPEATGIALVIFIVTVILSKMVSLGSILGALSLVISYPFLYSVEKSIPRLVFITVIVIFIVYKHKANIVRILKGEELKISFGKKKEETE